MKKTLLILLVTLCETMAFGQGKYRTENLIKLYSRPNFNSAQTIVNSGRYIEIITLTGNFLNVNYKNEALFMPYGSLKYCIPVDSAVINQKPTNDTIVKSVFMDMLQKTGG
ncbi:MAG: hypothetical protein WCW62_15850 [Bacteroidales bacterium]|jgi:hypothetical protein